MGARIRAAVMLMLLGLWMVWGAAAAETVVGDPEARLRVGQVEYGGETYRPKRRISSVLVLGTDHYAEEVSQAAYRSGVQADFLLLLVIDDNARTITPVQINRDTVTPIETFSAFGQRTGSWNAQICLAYSFGDGREQSCKLTADAVSRLLDGATIDSYMALNLDAIPVVNDELGGVTVTLEDDFSVYDPSMQAGTTLTLQGRQAEYYLRMRYGVGDATNASRLQRQRIFLENASAILREKVDGDSGFVERLLSAVQPYLITDMSRGWMINMGNRAVSYEILPMQALEGQNILGSSGFMEFYPDPDALKQLVLRVFYDRV